VVDNIVGPQVASPLGDAGIEIPATLTGIHESVPDRREVR